MKIPWERAADGTLQARTPRRGNNRPAAVAITPMADGCWEWSIEEHGRSTVTGTTGTSTAAEAAITAWLREHPPVCVRCAATVEPVGDLGWHHHGHYVCEGWTRHDEWGEHGPEHTTDPLQAVGDDESAFTVHRDTEPCDLCDRRPGDPMSHPRGTL